MYKNIRSDYEKLIKRILEWSTAIIVTIVLIIAFGESIYLGLRDMIFPHDTYEHKNLLFNSSIEDPLEWNADYIWINKDGNDAIPCDEADTWACFRKTFTIESADDIEFILARIAVDSRYWLYINDELVIREGRSKKR